jgi:metal-responsive CopG/Arc/MetJ family transcriptional regulator
MEAITLKLDGKILKEIDANLARYRYSTRTEFIRDAVRAKLSEMEKGQLLKAVKALAGSSKRKTADEQLHRVREELAKEYEQKFR